jgi:hypothetical protein
VTDDVLKLATARRKALLQEVARIDDFLSMAKALRSTKSDGSSRSFWQILEAAREPATVATSAADVIAGVEQILRAAGQPLSRGELHDKLLIAGVQVPGEDPVKNLGTMLWRSRRFDNTGRRYWFVDEPRPV